MMMKFRLSMPLILKTFGWLTVNCVGVVFTCAWVSRIRKQMQIFPLTPDYYHHFEISTRHNFQLAFENTTSRHIIKENCWNHKMKREFDAVKAWKYFLWEKTIKLVLNRKIFSKCCISKSFSLEDYLQQCRRIEWKDL